MECIASVMKIPDCRIFIPMLFFFGEYYAMELSRKTKPFICYMLKKDVKP